MRFRDIRVKKPATVRIVNPDPFLAYARTYRYDDRLPVLAGGTFRILAQGSEGRVLAKYVPPTRPLSIACPSDALLFQPFRDLELSARGLLDAEDRFDPDLPDWPAWTDASGAETVGRVRVPYSRKVLARFPMRQVEDPNVVAYREEKKAIPVEPPVARRIIRPGGTLTHVATFCGRLKVVYRENPWWPGGQCESGVWFWVDQMEYLRMAAASACIIREERREIAEIRSLLSRL